MRGLAKTTINKRVRGIRSALSYAVRDGIIPNNKLMGPHQLEMRTQQNVDRVLEVGEVIALMNTAADPYQKLVISLSYYCGLRRKEISYLQWQDVNLIDYRLVVLDRQLVHTKKRRSRAIAFREETARLFEQLYSHRVNECVFERPKAYYWRIGKWFPLLVEEAGIDHCTLHDLRRTCNTVMQDDGGIEEAVRLQILGQTSAQVNRDHYTGPLKKQQRAAIDSLPSMG
jgi:integrase